MSTPEIEHTVGAHPLSVKWVLWAHLPHNIDWSIHSYIPIATFATVEDAVSVTEMLPSSMIENCMLFLMKQGIDPMWEHPKNQHGGSFSYKVSNKVVSKVWRDLTYAVVGGTVSRDEGFLRGVTGITISPKKNFCIVKIWMTSCDYKDPEKVTREVKGLVAAGCLFKKHTSS